jgi:molybdate transport system substrate-binding protein
LTHAPIPTGVRVLASRAITYAYLELVPRFEAATGYQVDTIWSSTIHIGNHVASVEPFDLVIASAVSIEGFVKDGSVVSASRVDLMRSGVGVAVKEGAPKPDISSGDTVRRALLGARAVAYSQGPSGVYLRGLFEKLGVADAIAAKSVQSEPGTPVARYLANGDADLGFQQVSELIHEPGITFVGPLPADIQCVTVFSSAVLNRAESPEAAAALQAFLTDPAVDAVIRGHGMEPGRA